MKLVILGAVAAGAKAAAKARRLRPDAQIDIYTDDTHVSYSSCGLPYYIQGNFSDYETLLVRSPEKFESDGIHVHLQHRATKIIPESKQVLISSSEKSTLVDYDKLIITTGARAFIPPIPNINLKNIFTLRKIEDGISIREKLEQSKRAVIVGGSYIGVELLESFTRQDIYTTMIEKAPYIMPMFDPDISQIIKDQLMSTADEKFEILTDETILEFTGDADGVHMVRTLTRDIPVDFVVLCTGAVPNVEIARDAGIKLGETGAIQVNDRMETNITDIYAAGDCIETHFVMTNTKIWTPLGSVANKEGRCAAMNACGFYDTFPGVLGSAVTRCLDLTMSKTGLTERDALAAGFNAISATVNKNDKVGYMPDTRNITLKVVADSETGLLLGAQGIGTGDADKRINVLASALLGKLTIADFIDHDLTYAPPFSPTIDPLLNAAQMLEGKMSNTQRV